MNNPEGIEFLDTNTQLLLNATDDNAVRKTQQYIPSSFLDRLKDKRSASVNAPMGDMHHVASIPTSVVEKWMAEGFNIYDKNVGLKAILQRLRAEDMNGLIATAKSLY